MRLFVYFILAWLCPSPTFAVPICFPLPVDQCGYVTMQTELDQSFPEWHPQHFRYHFEGDLISDRTRLQLERYVRAGSHSNLIEFGIGHHLLGRFDLNERRLVVHEPLNAIDLRQAIGQLGIRSRYYPGDTTEFTLARNPVDLHTHFSGANRPESLLAAADHFEVLYPAELLREIRIDPGRFELSVRADGISVVSLRPQLLTPEERRRFLQALCIPPGEIAGFRELENAYRFREPIVRSPTLFAFLLEEIAKDYSRTGVRYAELSISARAITESGVLEAVSPVLRRIENQTGVRLRFLASIQRTLDREAMARLTTRVLDAASFSALAGVDFVGEEVNSVADFSPTIRRFSEFRRQARSAFQIRVHAGESPRFAENVRLAIEAGATRIGHGLYGIDEALEDTLRQRGIIVEMNLSSNIALGYLERYSEGLRRLEEYIGRGVPVTLGTDGAGVLSTDMTTEMLAAGQRIPATHQVQIYQTGQAYLERTLGSNCRVLFSNLQIRKLPSEPRTP